MVHSLKQLLWATICSSCPLQVTDHESERLARLTGDYLPEGPNLSAFYSAGDVDLSTLSELTESVPGKDASRGDGTRSKRTCVRVREGISRLEEILGNGGVSSSPPTRSVCRSLLRSCYIHLGYISLLHVSHYVTLYGSNTQRQMGLHAVANAFVL